MIPVGPDLPQAVREAIPWLAMGHGIFNAAVWLLFCRQGWLGHLIRRSRMSGTVAPTAAVRHHRRAGPLLVLLGTAGFAAGFFIALLDKGRIGSHPLHFSLGLTIVLAQLTTYAVSRKIRAREAAGRRLHRLLGILILCLYPVQILAGLAILL